ncbi:MAG: hypothetical protein OEW62_03705 [Candidatus Bathyarchaeota archaeon]|nr:hypothetical protein [Candidatus Bathyarchaeota archaeon]MDH5595746.1 hypothetical protein [Candidatus Bathyarchaeota archaeon]
MEQDKQIDIWLAEYQACHSNRNHYETIAWTIGSIFIVASFTLFGISFWEELANGSVAVWLLGFFSLLLMGIWLSYVVYVQEYVKASQKRLWKIEEELQGKKYDIQLHTTIKSKKRILRGR